MQSLAPIQVDALPANTGAPPQSPSDGSKLPNLSAKVLKRRAIRIERQHFSKVQQAAMGGEYRQADHLARQYLSSLGARQAAIFEANANLKKHHRLSKCQLPEIAETLNAWKGTSEEVTLLAKVKKNNNCDHRFVYRFGVRHRALQIMVRRVLQARVQLHPQQFLLQGGRDAACSAVIQALSEGLGYAAQIDIRSCYPSFDHRAVTSLLPLPAEVVDAVVIARNLNLRLGGFLAWPYPTEAPEGHLDLMVPGACDGIPAGSACADYAAQAMLMPILHSLNLGPAKWLYGDNLLILAPGEAELSRAVERVCHDLLGHPAGPLCPEIDGPHAAAAGFDFLGYRFSSRHGVQWAEPSDENLARFTGRFYSRLGRIGQLPGIAPERMRRIKQLKRSVRGWANSFALWENAIKFRDTKLAEITAKAG